MLAHPYTLGFVPATLLAGTSLPTIEIEGITPSDGIGDGSEPKIPLTLGLVYKDPLDGCAARFVKFLKSDGARQAIRRNNAVPID